jgi:hypothetical protein
VFITMHTGVTLNTDIQKGVFDRFRSLRCGGRPRWAAHAGGGAGGERVRALPAHVRQQRLRRPGHHAEAARPPVAGEVTWVLIWCAVLVAVFGPLTMYLYRTEQ